MRCHGRPPLWSNVSGTPCPSGREFNKVFLLLQQGNDDVCARACKNSYF